MEQLLNGHLYFNTIHYFAESEDTVNRGDPFERAVQINNIEIGGGNLQVIKQYDKDYACGNIFCLYKHEVVVTEANKKFQNEIEAKNLGDYCVVIHNHPEFIARVIKQLKKQYRKPTWGNVNYFDFSKGYINKTPYQKDLKFKHQKEYRFYINRKKNTPKSINIGNIEDVAYMTTIEAFLLDNFVYFDIEKLVAEKQIKERD